MNRQDMSAFGFFIIQKPASVTFNINVFANQEMENAIKSQYTHRAARFTDFEIYDPKFPQFPGCTDEFVL